MAKTLSRPPDAAFYEEDFPLWAERQAALLRARRFAELDLDNLIEEVEDLSRRERKSVESDALTVIEHFLPALYDGLRRPVARQLGKDGVRSEALPTVCPYTSAQVLDPDWYPRNAHGLEEPKL